MLSNLSLMISRILICCRLSGVRYLPSLMADLLFVQEQSAPLPGTKLSYKTLRKVYVRPISRRVLISSF